jgi:signal peptidase I
VAGRDGASRLADVLSKTCTVQPNEVRPAVAGPGRGLRVVTSSARTVAAVYLATLVGLLVCADVPWLLGWHPLLVLTGSMVPAIDPGDIVVTAPVRADQLDVGDIIVVRDPTRRGGSYTHRVVTVLQDGRVITRGDANPVVDGVPVVGDRVLGRVVLVVPVIGAVAVNLRNGSLPAAAAPTLATFGAAYLVILPLTGRRHRVRGARPGATPRRQGRRRLPNLAHRRWKAKRGISPDPGIGDRVDVRGGGPRPIG